MGSICSSKSSVKVENIEAGPKLLPAKEDSNKNFELIRKKKSQIFSTDISESSFAELSTPRNGRLTKWRRGELIGEGAYAKVYQCINLSNGELLAVKHFTVRFI